MEKQGGTTESFCRAAESRERIFEPESSLTGWYSGRVVFELSHQSAEDASRDVIAVGLHAAETGVSGAVAGAVHVGPELSIAVDAAIASVGIAIVVHLAGGAEVSTESGLGDESVSAEGISPTAGTPGRTAGFGRHRPAEHEETESERK